MLRGGWQSCRRRFSEGILLFCALPACGAPPDVDAAWDSLIGPGAPAVREPRADHNFLNHLFFESRTAYTRYQTSFTGQPTITGVINQPLDTVITPGVTPGIGYPPVYQGAANRGEAFLDFGTRGWLSSRVNTHFSLRYRQDLTHVDAGAPAQNIVETFPSNRRLELEQANIEINGASSSLTIGRQNVYGAEVASLDGAALTLNRGIVSLTFFGGRRFSFFGDPDQRAIGGANLRFRLNTDTSVEIDSLYYVKGSNSIALHRRLTPSWTIASHLRAYGGAPVDFALQGVYGAVNGRTSLRLNFFQKLSSQDYFYDFTSAARDHVQPRLYLGPLSPYSQVVIDARRQLFARWNLGGSIWLRRLNDLHDEGPYDTSFQDYRVNAQIFPQRTLETFLEYHQRDSDRLNPFHATAFDDIQAAGETSVKDTEAQVRRSFGEGRFSVSGGVYYRRISLQDRYKVVNNAHQSGWLAGAWWRTDPRTRVYFDYSLDSDFFVFRPDLAHSRVFRLGLDWKY